MNILDKIIDCYQDEEFLKADGFDDAVIGLDEKSGRLIYSVSKCLDIMVSQDEMSYEDAREYYEFNMAGAYVGDKTPIWCEDAFINNEEE